jgi:hypothetical protein
MIMPACLQFAGINLNLGPYFTVINTSMPV